MDRGEREATAVYDRIETTRKSVPPGSISQANPQTSALTHPKHVHAPPSKRAASNMRGRGRQIKIARLPVYEQSPRRPSRHPNCPLKRRNTRMLTQQTHLLQWHVFGSEPLALVQLFSPVALAVHGVGLQQVRIVLAYEVAQVAESLLAVQHAPDPDVDVPVGRVRALAHPPVVSGIVGDQREVRVARRPRGVVDDGRVAVLPQPARNVPGVFQQEAVVLSSR